MPSEPDQERIAAYQQQIRDHGIDALVCVLPSSVLLLSGFWPIVGNTIAVVTAASTRLLVPASELPRVPPELAETACTYELGSLQRLPTLLEAIEPPLHDLFLEMNLEHAHLGYEAGPWVQPSPYVSLSSFGETFPALLRSCLPHSKLTAVDDMLETLRLVKTSAELGRIRTSCDVARKAFTALHGQIHSGQTEMQVAGLMRAALMTEAEPHVDIEAFAFCMSGPNAAVAYKSYECSRYRVLEDGDTVLLHCNSHVNGYWTDVTRTFYLGKPTHKAQDMSDAMFAARAAALDAIRPGARCADVDAAARDVMKERGFAKQFKNPLGHGVGFAAMNAHAKPQLHPVSTDVLQQGMVFNVEPAIYIEGKCGMRHCDVVACGADGPEVMTDFQGQADRLIIL